MSIKQTLWIGVIEIVFSILLTALFGELGSFIGGVLMLGTVIVLWNA